MKEILRIVLIKYWMKVNKNVFVYELELMVLVFVLRDFKVFDKFVLEFVDKVINNDERVEKFLLLVEKGNLDVVEEFLSVLKDLNYCYIVELIDFVDIYIKVGKCIYYLYLFVFIVWEKNLKVYYCCIKEILFVDIVI